MTEEKKRDVLSPDLKVATTIYETTEIKKDKIWFNKLAKLLEGDSCKTTIRKSLVTLFDWGVIKAEYGEIKPGVAGRLLYITGERKQTIRQIYKDFASKNNK